MKKQVHFFLLLMMVPMLLLAQQAPAPTNKEATYAKAMHGILQTRYINSKGTPTAPEDRVRTKHNQDVFFYLLATVVSLLAFLKFFYARYFDMLFRVFFNTTLRQSQLTDQLLQAKLASLLYNFFFVAIGGIYIYLLLRYFNWIDGANMLLIITCCIGSLAVIYFGKFITLKITGWLIGYQDVTDTYLFVIFLVNKIVGIFLLPLVIIMVFSDPSFAYAAMAASFLLIILMLALRFLRSYSLLQNRMKVAPLHFLLYIVGIEALPILLLYKGLTILLLSKKL